MNVAPVDSKTAQVIVQEGVDANAKISDETLVNATNTVVPLLRNNINVTSSSGKGSDSTEVGLPEVSKPGKYSPEDLEKLIALLNIEADEKQLESAKERLQAMYDKLESDQQKVLEKLAKTLEEAEKVAAEKKKAEALGWIMMGLAILATAITTICTFGAGSVGALAIIGCVCSIAATTLSATNQILNATGVKDKFVEWKADKLQEENPGMTRKEAKEKASESWDKGWSIATTVCSVASMLCGLGSLIQTIKGSAAKAAQKVIEGVEKAAAEAAKETTKGLSKGLLVALKLAGTGVQTASAAVGIAQGAISLQIAELLKEQQIAAAELAELQAMLEEIQALIDEENEILEQLLMQLQNSLAFLATVLNAGTETVDKIMNMFNNV